MNNMLYILGSSLAQATGEDEIICRGTLRLTVTNSVEKLKQISDPAQALSETIAYIKRMTYDNWKAVIEGPRLPQDLANIGVKEPDTAVAELKQALVDQQSLLTMMVE